MNDNEKKKINDKKYYRKNTIVAIVGVILIAILFITCIDSKALEYYSFAEITGDSFTKNISGNYATYTKSGSWDFIASGDNYLEGYIIVKGNIPTHNIISFVDYRDQTHIVDTVTKVTDYSTDMWNIYSMDITGSNYTHYIRYITLSLNVTDEFNSMWFLINNAVDYHANYQVMEMRVRELNSPDYISHVTTVSGETDYTINQYTYNEPVIISDNLYTNDSKELIINGECVLTDAPIHYIYSVFNISKGELYNNNPTTLSIGTIQYINANHPNEFTNFNKSGAGYEFKIDLSEYDAGDNVIISISAQNIDNFLSNIIILENVIISGEIETETETETDTEVPDVPSIGDFEAGYAAAIRELSKSPLFGATVTGVMSYYENGEQIEVSRFQYVISKLTAQGGFSFKFLNGSIELIKEQHPDKDVYLSALQITFNREFLYENGLVLFGSNYNMPTYREGEYIAYWNPAITLSLSALNDVTRQFNAVLHNQRQTNLYNEFAYYYDFRFLSSFDDGRLLSIEFRDIIPDTFDAFINSAIYIPYSSYISIVDAQTYSYNQGWYDGRNSGLLSDSNVSYQKGFVEGQKYKGDVEYENGYNKGLEDANSLRTVILAPIDGITNLMTNMLNVNVLGFNLLDFIGGILLALLVIWVARRVL